MSSPLGNKQNITIFVLYLMQNVGYPLDFVTLNDIIMQTDYVAYLDFAETFSRLEESELIVRSGNNEKGEPTYAVIEKGAWQIPDRDASGDWSYIALHRVAVSLSHRGSGVSTAIIEYAESFARILGKRSLRIDTHEGNVVMRRMLEKHGFLPCGTIFLQNGDPRVAYEKVI